MGIFAINAAISIIQSNLGDEGKKFKWQENMFSEFRLRLIIIIPIRRGREAVMVYSIIYILA